MKPRQIVVPDALAFLVASTNLVLELGIVLWVLVGWKFTLGNILMGVLMIVFAYLLTTIYFPRSVHTYTLRSACCDCSPGA